MSARRIPRLPSGREADAAPPKPVGALDHVTPRPGPCPLPGSTGGSPDAHGLSFCARGKGWGLSLEAVLVHTLRPVNGAAKHRDEWLQWVLEKHNPRYFCMKPGGPAHASFYGMAMLNLRGPRVATYFLSVQIPFWGQGGRGLRSAGGHPPPSSVPVPVPPCPARRRRRRREEGLSSRYPVGV